MQSNDFDRAVRTPGLVSSRIAEVIVTQHDGARRRGSGYRVTATTVITSAHTIVQGKVLEVRFDADQDTEWSVFAEPQWLDESTDLAVLAFEARIPDTGEVAPPQYGRLADEHAILDAYAAGFPRWKWRTSAGEGYRELHDAYGKLSALSNRRGRTLEITVEPPHEDPDPDVSPWEGMSGAALWTGGTLIGVIVEHHRAEGLNRLTATRIDRCLDLAGSRRAELASLLGLVGDPVELVGVMGRPPVSQLTENRSVRYPLKARLPRLAASHQVRPEQLELEEILDTDRLAVSAQGSALATGVLTGTAGVGKTQIARAYADKAWDDPTLAAAAWIDAGSRQEIVNGYAAVARRITGRSEQEPEQAIDDLMDWLGSTDRRWLVVFDGLHDPQDLVGLWPPDTPTGRLVITTRDQAFSLWNGKRNLVPVHEFSKAQSEAYLYDRLRTNPGLLDGVADLADTLGHLPLALDHAAAVMLFRQWTAETYRSQFLDESNKLLEIVPRPHELMPTDKYRDTIATTWQISISQADSQPPERVARELLVLASVLRPNGIPVSLFKTPAVLDHLSGVLRKPITAQNTHDGLALLDRFSLVTAPELNSPFATVSVHLLVQRATREDFPPHKLGEIAKVAADALDQIWPDDETQADTDALDVLHANAAALDKVADAHLIGPDDGCHAVLLRVGHSLGRLGRRHAARTYFLQLAARTAQALGEDNLHTLRIRRHAASALGYTRDYKGALDEFDPLYRDYCRIAGDCHVDTVDVRGSRASYQALAGDVAGAVTELESVLHARQHLLDPFHVDTLTTRARLAKWRGHLGFMSQAIEELEKLLLDYRERQPEETRAIFLTRATLATLRGHSGNPAAAAAELQSLLEDQIRLYGPGQSTINTRTSLIHWYRMAKNGAAAKDARHELVAEQDRLLREFEERYGHKHPDTLAWRAGLMAAYPVRRDRLAEAVAAQRMLVADQEDALSPWHPVTLESRLKLASLVGGSGDPTAAVAELQEVLDIGTQRHGATFPLVIRTLARLASWQAREGDPAQAVRTSQIVLARQHQASAPTAHVTTTLTNLVTYHQAAGNWLCVGETLCTLLAHLRTTLPQDHPDVLRARLRIAMWRAESGNTDFAVNELRQVAHDYTASLSGVHGDTMAARLELARWLWEAGHSSEARQTLAALVADQRTHLGERDRRTLANEKTLRSWRQSLDKTSATTPVRPRRGSRHYRNPREYAGSLPTALTHTAAVGMSDAYQVERLADLISESPAWAALLESLALAIAPGLPRRIWIVMANALSATELVDTGDIDQLLAEAGEYINVDLSNGTATYRLSHPMMGRKVLSTAAQRTGLTEELNIRLRNRQIAETLIMQFPLDSYVFKNLPRHAAAGDWLHHLAWNPATLDYIDLEMLTAEVLQAGYGDAKLPNEFAGALQVRHLLKELPPGDRAVVRGMVTTRSSRAGQRFTGRRKPGLPVDTATPMWTLLWARQSRDPHHITLVGRPTRSRFRDRDDQITALALATYDGANVLAVGHQSGSASLLDLTTGFQYPVAVKIGDSLVALEVLPADDSALLAVIGKANIQVWGLLDRGWQGEPMSAFDGGIQAATAIPRPNADTLLAVAEGSGHVVLYDPRTGSIVDRSNAQHDHQVNSICHLPFPNRSRACFATAGDGSHVTIWEIDPLQPADIIMSRHKGPVTSLAAVDTGKQVLLCTGGKDGGIAFWDPQSRQQVHPGFIRAHRGAVLFLTPITQRGRQANLASGGEDDVVRLWDISTGRRIGAPLTGHTARVQALAVPTLASGHRVIASSGHDGSVRLWDLQDAWQLDRSRNIDKTHRPGNLADDTRHAATAMTSARLEHEQQLQLVVGHRNGTIQRYNPDNGALVGEPIQAHSSAVRIMTALSMRDGRHHVATVGNDSCIKIWDFTSTHPVAELQPSGKGEVRVLRAIHRGGRDPLLAIGDSGGTVRLWNPTDRDEFRFIKAHTEPITSMTSVELDYHTTRLVTGGADFRIRFWDPDTGQHDDGPDIDNNHGPIYAMELIPSPDGPVLAASGHETRGTIRLYRLPQRDALTGLSIQLGDILMNTMASVATANEHPLLVGVGRKSAIRVWRPDTAELIHRLDIEGPILASHVFGTRLALSTKRGLYQLHLTAAERAHSDRTGPPSRSSPGSSKSGPMSEP